MPKSPRSQSPNGIRVKTLLVTPPMLQPNSPYPATPFLTAFLRRRGVDAVQEDFSLALALALFSRDGLRRIARELRVKPASAASRSASVRAFLSNAGRYAEAVEPAVAFLQGRAPELAPRLASREWLPEGPRFRALGAIALARRRPNKGSASRPAPDPVVRQAEWIASLFLDDIADVIRDGIDPRFGFSRYGEKLAASAPDLAPLLPRTQTLVTRMLDEIVLAALERHRPRIVALTVPFPGNVCGAFQIAKAAKAWSPRLCTVLGGGYASTELRSLGDPRLFDGFDYVVLDDGEQPLLRIVEHVAGRRPVAHLVRTYARIRGAVRFLEGPPLRPLRHRARPAPCYDGLSPDRYIRMRETSNPMYTLWSDSYWNKLMLAHGCYWHRCAFCDTRLDYIRRYDPAPAETIVRWIRSAIRQTGRKQFHFVDEAAPPALLRRLAELLLQDRLSITWWANIRFEKSFTPKLASLLARSGCVALTGGIETAGARTLQLMNKGVSLEQAASSAHSLAQAGIMVHAYLMYGFPTQTVQETVDALEFVRQLFAARALHSAFWHRFSLTVHSPIHEAPERFGIRLHPSPPASFARNEAAYAELAPVAHDQLGAGLKTAVYNYMHGVGLREDVRAWFDLPVPAPRLGRRWVSRVLRARPATASSAS